MRYPFNIIFPIFSQNPFYITAENNQRKLSSENLSECIWCIGKTGVTNSLNKHLDNEQLKEKDFQHYEKNHL